MRSDFHFFVDDVKDKIRAKAEEETIKVSVDGKIDEFLLNTNLNTRLIRAWEDCSQEQRDEYMLKEEDDRQRYIQDDEIASRHCATLTARSKSPRPSHPLHANNDEERQTVVKEEDDSAKKDTEDSKKRSSPVTNTGMVESPTKKAKPRADHDEQKPKEV